MTSARIGLTDTIYHKALALAKKSVAQTVRERGASATAREITQSARILVESDPKWIELAKAKVLKTVKPKRGGW